MFAEYGVDPQLISAWANHPIGDVLRPLFGVETGRLVSRFPKDWAKQVRDLWERETDQNRRKNIEVLLIHLKEKLVSRNRDQFQTTRSWLENTEIDDTRVPFKKILSESNPRGHANVLTAGTLHQALLAEFSNRANTFSVMKTSAAMVAFLGDLFRCAGEIKFVDKNFYPRTTRFTDPLVALLVASNNQRPGGRINKIEYHLEYDSSGRHAQSIQEYVNFMPTLIPRGFTIEFFFWEERIQWGLHNRYILTDIGGFTFGMGLDNSPPRAVVADTVARLDSGNLTALFNKFSRNQMPEILLKDTVTVVGIA